MSSKKILLGSFCFIILCLFLVATVSMKVGDKYHPKWNCETIGVVEDVICFDYKCRIKVDNKFYEIGKLVLKGEKIKKCKDINLYSGRDSYVDAIN